jgi:hypothetical protein
VDASPGLRSLVASAAPKLLITWFWRKEVAQQVGLNLGTLASRLATARRLLATRLSRYGLTLSGCALAAAVAQNTASAKVPISLVWSAAEAATLIAAGQFAGVSAPAVVLMKGAI